MTSDQSHLYLDMKGRLMTLSVYELEGAVYLKDGPNGTIQYAGGVNAVQVRELSRQYNFTYASSMYKYQ